MLSNCKSPIYQEQGGFYSIGGTKKQLVRKGEDNERDRIAAKCLGDYQFALDLFDEKLGRVTEKEIERFESLFVDNAKIFDDISAESGMIDFKDYVSLVFSFLPNNGVAGDGINYYYDYGSIVFSSDLRIDDLEEEYFIYVYPVRKQIAIGLDKNNKPVKLKKPKEIDLDVIIVSSAVKKDAKILTIRPRRKIDKNQKL